MSEASLERQVAFLVRDVDSVTRQVKTNTARLDIIERRGEQRNEWEKNISEDVATLKRTLDKLTWAIVGTGLTLAGSMVGLAITIGSGAH